MSSLFYLILKILFRREAYNMAIIYAALIIKGKKTYAQVPSLLQAQVKEVLTDLDVTVDYGDGTATPTA